ncbi:MAG: N-acetylmuramoyl-L-alanine amidase, partial [Candidatus Krumholzibacteriia bacterium]
GRRTPPAVTVILPARAAALAVAVLSDPEEASPRRAHLAWTTPDGRPAPAGQLGWPGLGPAGLRDLAGPAGVVLRGDGPPVWVPARAETVALAVTEQTLARARRLVPVTDAGPHPWRDRLDDGTAPLPELVGGLVYAPGAALWRESAGRVPVVDPPDAAGFAASASLVPALDGAIVVVDPAGGGSDHDGAGPMGLRGADVNLAVARRLARLLEGCGARAVLTRDEGEAPTATAKAALADAVGAHWFLTIGRATAGAASSVGHHPASVAGQAWAGHAAAALGALLPHLPTVAAPSWSYLLRHTACPALEIALPGPDDAAAERRLEQPAWQAAEARALLLGLAAAASGGALPVADPARILPALPGAPAVAEITWALWDGNLPWYPLPAPAGPPAAAPVSSGMEPGLPAPGSRHVLEVHTRDAWQLWRLERTGPDTWSGSLAAGGPEQDTPDHE